MLTAWPHTPPLKSINQTLNIWENRIRLREINSKTPAARIFILLNGIYQDCSFLLLISYYIIIISSSSSVFFKIQARMCLNSHFRTYVQGICVK